MRSAIIEPIERSAPDSRVRSEGAAGEAEVDLIGERHRNRAVAALRRHRDDLDALLLGDIGEDDLVELILRGVFDRALLGLGGVDHVAHRLVGPARMREQAVLEQADVRDVLEVVVLVLRLEHQRLEREGERAATVDRVSVGLAPLISMAATPPPAPGLLVTRTGWPRLLLIGSATARKIASVPPPAPKPMTMLIGLIGKSCANAGPASDAASEHRCGCDGGI